MFSRIKLVRRHISRSSVMSLARSSSTLSPWTGVKLGPKDPIFGLMELYQEDPDPKKLNLAVGAYRGEDGKPWILPVVRKVEADVVARSTQMEYLPIIGSAKFLKEATKLAYGDDCNVITQNRLAAIQTISGTGALRVAFDFLARFLGNPLPSIYVPDPTYANHYPILKDSGFPETKKYRYIDKKTNSLDESGLLQDLKDATEGSLVLLHAVAHNPTGVDPTPEQWSKISQVCKERKLLPIFDCAYLGFASGDVDKDAISVRKFVEDGHRIVLCQSFAKNFGLYGHRIGCLSFVTDSSEEKQRVESQLKILARAQYSNPPLHGARIVEEILGDPKLKAQWMKEVKMMADRINSARHALKSELIKHGSERNWDHLTNQIGMFCYTGLNKDQAHKLMKEWHIYITSSGRISMAGVNLQNAKYIAEGIHAVTQSGAAKSKL